LRNPTYLRSDYYGFFTKYSLLDNYGFFNGLSARVMHKILPEYIEQDSFEKHIHSFKTDKKVNGRIVEFIDFDKLDYSQLEEDIYYSIIALSSKVTAFGLDKRIKNKLDILSLDVELFSSLSKSCADIDNTKPQVISDIIKRIKLLLVEFRKQKSRFGTSIHITYKTRLVNKFLDRLDLLVNLYYNKRDKEIWNSLINEYITAYTSYRSIKKYCKYHFDLLLLQVVEHTSKKGEKYIAENHAEYLGFLKKSMIAGGVISIFALIKIYLDSLKYSDLSNAMLFSLNYAFCFIIAKKLGGIIATKQPAMTASTISKYIDKNDNLKLDNIKGVIDVVKNTSRSQIISLIGNVTVALPSALIIFAVVSANFNLQIIDAEKIDLLKNNTSIFNLINLYYAAIAGLFLSLAGFISGYIDNKLIFTNFRNRIRDSRFMNYMFSPTTVEKISKRIENQSGATIGNVFLGFFLGCAFLFGELLSIPFDIRHIAFSASNLGVLVASEGVSLIEFGLSFCGIWMIGIVNFLVSFLITLIITLKTRGITAQQVKQSCKGLLKELFRSPLSFFYFKKPSV